MDGKGVFTQTLLGEKNNDRDDIDDEVIVPDDDEIEEKLKVLDEVVSYFREEKLLGVNSYKKVCQSSDNAKKGINKKKFSKSIL